MHVPVLFTKLYCKAKQTLSLHRITGLRLSNFTRTENLTYTNNMATGFKSMVCLFTGINLTGLNVSPKAHDKFMFIIKLYSRIFLVLNILL